MGDGSSSKKRKSKRYNIEYKDAAIPYGKEGISILAFQMEISPEREISNIDSIKLTNP